MSDQYNSYVQQKLVLQAKHTTLLNELKQCEDECELLRSTYSKTCDHPTRVLQFPVCGICNAYVMHM